jgi:hypothetical protein
LKTEYGDSEFFILYLFLPPSFFTFYSLASGFQIDLPGLTRFAEFSRLFRFFRLFGVASVRLYIWAERRAS